MGRGHHLRFRIEGELVHFRPGSQQRLAMDVGERAEPEQRKLHGIAHALAVAGLQAGVAAQNADLKRALEWRIELGRVARGIEDLSRCVIDLIIGGRQPQALHRHAVLGEGAGLVGADDGGGAKGLDRRQALHHRIALGHAPHAPGERHRRHDGEALGDGRDGKRDRRLDHQEEIFARGDAGHGNEGGDEEGGLDQLSGQLGELLLERRAIGLRLDHEPGGEPELRRHAGRDHDAGTGATRDRRALMGHREAVGDDRLARDRGHALLHRGRFAGEGRLVAMKIARLDQAHIGGDDVAAFEHDDVARYQLLGRQRDELALPLHPRRARAEFLQRFHGPRGAELGHEADQGVDQKHEQDGGRLGPFAEQGGKGGGARKQRDDRALELIGEDGECRCGRMRLQRIRPVLGKAAGGVLLA